MLTTLGGKNLIEINHLSFNREEQVIFDDMSIAIPKGKVTAIMGPSGTGKTTLLRLIGGELSPQSGSILVEGQDVAEMGQIELYNMRRNMGMLFQSGALFTDMNVFDNVAFPLREHTQLSETLINDLVLLKLQAVGLRGAKHLMPRSLSGGMARRVALARAIALDPHFIMYDEPFTGQDPISMGVLVKLIKLLNQAMHMTSIIVSHDVPEAASIADYIYVIAGGKVIAHGTPTELSNNQSQQVQQFLQGLPDGPVPFHYPAQGLIEEIMSGKKM